MSQIITKIDGGSTTVDSPEFSLGNYHRLAFLIENPAGQALTVTVKGNTEDGAAEAVRFRFKEARQAREYEDVDAEGKEITDAGLFLVEVNDGILAKGGFDRASVHLTTDTGDVAAAYVIQDNPRYSGGDE